MKNHLTLRIYPNKHYVSNIVAEKDLKNHIEYNSIFRFGCVFYVDGKRVYNGCIKEDCLQPYDEVASKFFIDYKEDVDRKMPTIPYS